VTERDEAHKRLIKEIGELAKEYEGRTMTEQHEEHKRIMKEGSDLIKESKSTMRAVRASDALEADPWRTPEDAEKWASDYYELRDHQGCDDAAATESANVREATRFSAKVDQVLIEQAMNHCVKRRMEIYGSSEEEAKQKCTVDFKKCLEQRGEKAYESKTLADLDVLYRKLMSEILYFMYNPRIEQQTPYNAERSARKKLGLPNIVIITKSEAWTLDNGKLLSNMRSALDMAAAIQGKEEDRPKGVKFGDLYGKKQGEP
jgi:hypothetical protein